MELPKKCIIRIHLRRYINDHIHRNSLYLTEIRKHQMQNAFIQHLQIYGILETEEEIAETRLLTIQFLNQHQNLQDRYGIAFLKREAESKTFTD